MKKSTLFASVMWIALSLGFAAESSAAGRGIQVKRIDDLSHESGKLGGYKALIIGINDYENPKIPDLETPVNDATAIAKVLKEKYGFEVKLLLDREATRETVYKELRKLATSTEPDDSVLIYFAGHGDLDRTYDDGWWIPADATAGNPVTYLDNGQVQKAMRSMKARHVLLISDSCYSGTLFGNPRSLPPVIDDKYYLSLYNEKSRWGMTSGNRTPVSDQGSNGHSVFANQFIKELEKSDKPFLSTQEIYTRIAPVIANNSEQTPLCRPMMNIGDQGGEFVFVAALKKQMPQAVPWTQKDTIDKEILFWQSIQDSDDPALFEAYLKTFPNGVFVPIAKRKIEGLKQKQTIISTPPASGKSKLFVEVEPSDARVRILNIVPRFEQGMELVPGSYHVEASKPGYGSQETWIDLGAGENKRIEIKLEPLQASIQPSADFQNPSSTSNETKREGVYVAYPNGIVKDTKTGLEWKTGPDKDTSWKEANLWVKNLNVDGGGWKMPSESQLKTLYREGAGTRNMTSLLKTTGWWVWTIKTSDSPQKASGFLGLFRRSACSSCGWIFYFARGGYGYWVERGDSSNMRAFAVRSRSND